MLDYKNPFEYEAANKFTNKQIIDFYIQDFNFSRFVRSRRNVFLVGERGTGKTMTLLYNSLPVRLEQSKAESTSMSEYEVICVYVPCNTTLTHKTEYLLLDHFLASVISEHFLVLTIMDSLIASIAGISDLLNGCDEKELKEDLLFMLDLDIPQERGLFNGLRMAFQKEVALAQKALNSRKADAFYDNAMTFSAGVIPLLKCIRKIPRLENSHFALMLDDAHNLNPYQIRALNSWIAYRDNTVFSFKVATTKVERPSLLTASGGNIIEGHDFTSVDLEQPYQNKYSAFGKLAHEIIERRLASIGIDTEPEKFFPMNAKLKADIEKCRIEAEEKAKGKYPSGTTKQINDYVYKYGRAEYFRSRSIKSNTPPYSGFEMLVHLSTGVIRNLLEPCYWMYDRAISNLRSQGKDDQAINCIPPQVQTEIILDRSTKMWEWIKNGLDKNVEGCSREQAGYIFQLFDNLAILFRERLQNHQSEPRAIVFSISDTQFPAYPDLLELLIIARKAQILYSYSSSAKDSGRREDYYVPNRILWPVRMLDPVGQYSRVSLKARDLWAAATENRKLPFISDEAMPTQLGMYDRVN